MDVPRVKRCFGMVVAGDLGGFFRVGNVSECERGTFETGEMGTGKMLGAGIVIAFDPDPATTGLQLCDAGGVTRGQGIRSGEVIETVAEAYYRRRVGAGDVCLEAGECVAGLIGGQHQAVASHDAV